MSSKKLMTIKISEDMYKDFQKIANKMDVSVSALVKNWMFQYIEAHKDLIEENVKKEDDNNELQRTMFRKRV